MKVSAFFSVPGRALILGGESPLCARYGEALAEGKGKPVRGCLKEAGGKTLVRRTETS